MFFYLELLKLFNKILCILRFCHLYMDGVVLVYIFIYEYNMICNIPYIVWLLGR